MKSAVTAIGLMLTIGSAAAAEIAMTPDDRKIIDSCIVMIDEFMMKDKACTEAMKRTSLAQADMTLMRGCRKMTPEAMDRDKQCTAMREKYPGLMVVPEGGTTSSAGGATQTPDEAARR